MLQRPIILLTLVALSSCDLQCQKFSLFCLETQCTACVQAHPCCVWCYAEDFEGRRCNSRGSQELEKCTKLMDKNGPSETHTTQDLPFRDLEEDEDPRFAIQLRPRSINLKLRVGDPLNITVKYQPSKNYPLDLYYLMDLTLSMRADLETMTQLGLNLTVVMDKLTKNYKIAFGSYVDKIEMPFYLTDDSNFHNPCNLIGGQCEQGYLFKHRLNFTKTIEDFIERVKQSSVSGNVDNLEGGFDALMQILLCQNQIGWSQNSRKIVLLATESPMHLAGDGILLGVTRRNPGLCLIDHEGNYRSLDYDYPSLEELHHQLSNRKVNLIIASKENSIRYYNAMEELIKEALFVGKLERDSTNILKLVEDGYYDLMKQVKLSLNLSMFDDNTIKVDFFKSCKGDEQYVKGNQCDNAKEGEVILFQVQITLNKHVERLSDVLYIEERNINEKVQVNVEYVGSRCACEETDATRSTDCGAHGFYACAYCNCEENWFGPKCEQQCDQKSELCRYREDGEVSKTCFGNGQCNCGKCDCNSPYAGTYCNYTCPHDPRSNQICGGQGDCDNLGQCHCNKDHIGEDCSCSLSTDNCKIPGASTICNDHGSCNCNRCQCHHGYRGSLCEICDKCDGFCNYFTGCIDDTIATQKNSCRIGEATVNVNWTNDPLLQHTDRNQSQVCYYRYTDENGATCDTSYFYTFNVTLQLDVQNPNCGDTLAATLQIGGSILGGLLLIGLLALIGWMGWKHRERTAANAELELLVDQQQKSSCDYIETSPLHEHKPPLRARQSINPSLESLEMQPIVYSTM